MLLRWPTRRLDTSRYGSRWILFAVWAVLLVAARGMSPARIAELRKETVAMFYHGFDNYMQVAFPEDELKPVSCTPLTRDSRNPRNVELNDVLGNYSLTLIDSLSTLAILASAPPDSVKTGEKALRDFQDGVASLLLQYGDGTTGPAGKGLRARGFDLDSKVQVFETVIRGVGGLLSAHLFASGELPISGYKPRFAKIRAKTTRLKGETPTIVWPNGLRYDGQLLRLALDLAQRLLPAFYTDTGMPYPRVNLRHGIPFYLNSPLHRSSNMATSLPVGPVEITETCSAGAGSLVLEFTLLSRLTDDPRFEQLAKRAFWAVWNRRSAIDLIGAGVDAESGNWIGPISGIGAGIDSFFEYALKTHILLSGHETPNLTVPLEEPHQAWLDPNTIYSPLSEEENSPDAFLEAWHEAHAAIKRHVYSNTHHPHYVNVHLSTGSPQAYWIDSLGAYYPGLLTLAGEVEEAIETNLLYTALWTRYAALPERWSVRDGQVEGGLSWWPGRPEFIESNYHLYRATRDPWYLHVGEMVLEDITRRCWTDCGWSGLQDVRTGEKSDRMESFFLGETAKYLYLLFDPDHPLNSLDAAYVFTTEGHPLLIPQKKGAGMPKPKRTTTRDAQPHSDVRSRDTCPVPPPNVPFTVSATAARPDIFHAASLIGLHLIPNSRAIEAENQNSASREWAVSERTTMKHTNHTYYPWTLPESLMAINGTCDRLPLKQTFTIEFPVQQPQANLQGAANFVVLGSQALIRLDEGILVKSLSGLKLGLVYESPSPYGQLMESWRVWTIANFALGRDERILIPREVIGDMTDPIFHRIRDSIMLDIVLQVEVETPSNNTTPDFESYNAPLEGEDLDIHPGRDLDIELDTPSLAADYRTIFSSFIQHVTSALTNPSSTSLPHAKSPQTLQFISLPAISPTGLGAAPIIDAPEAPDPNQAILSAKGSSERLDWSSIYFAGDACNEKLPDEAVRNHEVIVMKRGGCRFTDKLANIPSFTPSAVKGLKLVIVVSSGEDDEGGSDADSGPGGTGYKLIRPLLDKIQTTPSGLVRHHPISMVLVGGGEETLRLFRRASGVGIRRRYHIESGGLVVGNIVVV